MDKYSSGRRGGIQIENAGFLPKNNDINKSGKHRRSEIIVSHWVLR